MATTTPQDICDALAVFIESLTPSGGTASGIESAYKAASDFVSGWDNRPHTDIDRQFIIHPLMSRAVETVFGALTEMQMLSELVIEIGHFCGNWTNDANRMSKDLLQLEAQIQRCSKFNSTFITSTSSAVSHIEFESSDFIHEPSESDPESQESYWVTKLTFAVHYSALQNYGG